MELVQTKRYGLVPNVTSSAVRTANTAALRRMLSDQSVAASSKGEKIILPKGIFYFNETIVLYKAVVIEGQGGSRKNGGTILVWPAGMTGFFTANIDHGTATQATGALLRNCIVSSEFNGWHNPPAHDGTYTDRWTANQVITVDKIVNGTYLPVDDPLTVGAGWPSPHPGMCYGYAYKAIAVTGDARCAATYDLEPAWENIFPMRNSAVTTTSGNGVSPITITSAIVKPNSLCVLTGHRLETGMWVRISGVVGNTAANGIHQITKTGDGTFTIAGTGNGAYVSGGTVERVIVDDAVTWLPIEAHGIDAKTKITLENVSVTGFPGNGLNFNCSVNHPYYSNANLSSVSGGDFEQNGGAGVLIYAGDTAEITLKNVNSNQNFGFGYDVKAGSNCGFLGLHAAINPMGDFRTWDSTNIAPYSEGSYRPCIVYGTGQWIGGTPGGDSDLQFTGHYSYGFDPVVWAAGQATDVGKFVKLSPDNGYIYKVKSATGAKQLAAPPAFVPKGFGDLEAIDYKLVTSGDCTLAPFAQSIVSSGQINLSTRHSAQMFRNLPGSVKYEFYAGYTGETLGPTAYGPFGWKGDATVDGGQAWSVQSTGAWWGVNRAGLGNGYAMGWTFGAVPRTLFPNGAEFRDVGSTPAVTPSGWTLFSDASALKAQDSNGFAPLAMTHSAFTFGRSLSGGDIVARSENSNNASTTAHATISAKVGGTSGGNPSTLWEIPSGTSYRALVDNADGDVWKLVSGTAHPAAGVAGLSFSGALGFFAVGAKAVDPGEHSVIQGHGSGNAFTNVWANNTSPTGRSGFYATSNSGPNVTLKSYASGAGAVLGPGSIPLASKAQLNVNGGDDLLIGHDGAKGVRLYTGGIVRLEATSTGNIGIGATTATNYQSMAGGIFMANGTGPSGNPAGGVFLVTEGGLTTIHDPAGIATVLN